ncbi:mannose-6-phosphate isomerase, class I [Aquibacillus sp. 3ASR75-11]|uniref:Mannose-6-phosphate isomerase n=1 Tax=Terrihalobacillus insolitus TaxID=2950438 RepID=A0A9X3WSA3_9BACI|nr:mannose-6-phosphate isomerase, class I [Terrihalobacillus insolitus]MDC3411963.1 mannose-6-phosphate isomerase, class I [Terrihalobacillus insolitus]MDC3423351.1 mannose-6-phosphate isomerase, class I [Terrihalobacillus insolitus]
MYKEPIFLQPVFQDRIWGGQKLSTEFDYAIPYKRTGEAWVISAHPNGPSVIKNGPLEGKTLADAWKGHGGLFNKSAKQNEEYPLLVKILDANDDLSVQVHPDDAFARKVEGVPYGKTECWYVLSAEEGAELVLGHHAQTPEELEEMVENQVWDSFLRRVKVKAGDFVYVPSGTIHAIGKGIVILETQQSSDITYRVYDYDRTDSNGNKRELHLDRAIQVTTVPHRDVVREQEITKVDDLTVKQLVEAEYFSVYHWELNGNATLQLEQDFLQVSVIEGNATISVKENDFPIAKGSQFILPYGITEYKLSGEAEFIVSHV